MKRLVILLLLAVISVSAYAQKNQGESSVGINIGYGFDSENATIGLDYRYAILDNFRIAPSVTHFVKNDGLKAWVIDLNAHYLFRLSDMFSFYPLAGLSLSFWDWEYIYQPPGGGPAISNDETRFGANIGLGGEVYASRAITVGAEFKYNIIKDLDQALIALRVGYNF